MPVVEWLVSLPLVLEVRVRISAKTVGIFVFVNAFICDKQIMKFVYQKEYHGAKVVRC